jgi:hypothetical protein
MLNVSFIRSLANNFSNARMSFEDDYNTPSSLAYNRMVIIFQYFQEKRAGLELSI